MNVHLLVLVHSKDIVVHLHCWYLTKDLKNNRILWVLVCNSFHFDSLVGHKPVVVGELVAEWKEKVVVVVVVVAVAGIDVDVALIVASKVEVVGVVEMLVELANVVVAVVVDKFVVRKLVVDTR